MEYPIYYYSDYTDNWEWSLNRYLASSMRRGDAAEGLVAFLLVASLLVGWLLVKFLMLVLRRLWDIYQARANAATTGGNVLQWAAFGLLLLWALSLLVAVIWPDWAGVSFVVASAALLTYTCLSEWVDYQASKLEARPALPDVSINDIIHWKAEVDEAQSIAAAAA
jgi:hypothetical protein